MELSRTMATSPLSPFARTARCPEPACDPVQVLHFPTDSTNSEASRGRA